MEFLIFTFESADFKVSCFMSESMLALSMRKTPSGLLSPHVSTIVFSNCCNTVVNESNFHQFSIWRGLTKFILWNWNTFKIIRRLKSLQCPHNEVELRLGMHNIFTIIYNIQDMLLNVTWCVGIRKHRKKRRNKQVSSSIYWFYVMSFIFFRHIYQVFHADVFSKISLKEAIGWLLFLNFSSCIL